MKRLLVLLGIVACLWSPASWSQTPATLPADVAGQLQTALASNDASQVAALINANPGLASLIATQVVASGNPTMVTTLLNAAVTASNTAGTPLTSNSVLTAFTSALANSGNAALVSTVLANVPAAALPTIAGEIKAAAPAGSPVANIPVVAAATAIVGAPIIVVNLTPPPPLVVNPNQNNGSAS